MEQPKNSEQQSAASESDKQVLERALKRFQLAESAEAELRKVALDDLKFSAGDQWPDDIKQERISDNRPCLTINRIPQFIRQVTNDQRQNRPAIKISPVDDNADKDTARIYQGIIRHIEQKSNADTAYDTAFDSAARAGFGYFRITTDYVNPKSFNQEIRFGRIPDRFNVYLDPYYTEPDGSDANWGFVFEEIPPEEFKAQYPTAKLSAMSEWGNLSKSTLNWIGEKARVAEYFERTFRETEIVQLSTLEVVEASELAKIKLPPEIKIINKRKTVVPEVKWYKINGIEILDRTDWKGKWIPIVPVIGEELVIEGKKTLAGIVRYAKDPQKMYNIWKSYETETIALAPRAPWVGYEGQFEGHEAKWKNAHRKNFAYLEVKPKTFGGTVAPLPQRNVFEPPVQAITQASLYAADDLKSTTGIYDAALGAKSNENSGVAIQRRNVQSQTSNFHLVDNLSKSIRHAGRICVDLIPHIYDTPQAIRILGEDGAEEVVKINQEFEKDGKKTNYMLDRGEYDVSVSSGPSFETKRQEAAASMLDFTKALPSKADSIADLVVRNMDWPGAQEIADRLKKMLPPELTEENKNQKLPPQAQQQMAQMNQMIDALTKQLNEANQKVETKSMELESKERIEFAKMEQQATLELAKLESHEATLLLAHQMAELSQRLKLVGINQPIEYKNNGAGSEQAGMPNEFNQPTGGLAPGNYVGEQP